MYLVSILYLFLGVCMYYLLIIERVAGFLLFFCYNLYTIYLLNQIKTLK